MIKEIKIISEGDNLLFFIGKNKNVYNYFIRSKYLKKYEEMIYSDSKLFIIKIDNIYIRFLSEYTCTETKHIILNFKNIIEKEI